MRDLAGFRLVLRHSYRDHGGRDLSGRGNHGYRVLSDTPPPQDWSSFRDAVDRVYVPPSSELSSDGGHLILVGARLDRLSTRSVIVEGYLSFSIHVEGDGTLMAGVLVGGEWIDVVSAPGAIGSGVPFEVAFLHSADGLLQLVLDGALAGSRRHALGTPRGISWPYGLNIGAWPDANLRLFDGRIDHLDWWRTRSVDRRRPVHRSARAPEEQDPGDDANRVLLY